MCHVFRVTWLLITPKIDPTLPAAFMGGEGDWEL